MTYKTLGIVLKKMPYGEKQSIVFVFTPDYGKIKIIVDKKKVKNRFRVEELELFSEYIFLLKKGRNFDKCIESDVFCSYSKIIENYDQILCAEYFLEIIYMITPFFIPDKKFTISVPVVNLYSKPSNSCFMSSIDEFIRYSLGVEFILFKISPTIFKIAQTLP